MEGGAKRLLFKFKLMRQTKIRTILDGKNSTGAGTAALIADYRHKVLTVATDGMGSGDTITVKVQGSCSETAPDFDSAKSWDNEWDYIQVIDLEDGSAIDGDTGISFADSDDLRKFAINIDGLRWINVTVTNISDPTNTKVYAKVTLYND